MTKLSTWSYIRDTFKTTIGTEKANRLPSKIEIEKVAPTVRVKGKYEGKQLTKQTDLELNILTVTIAPNWHIIRAKAPETWEFTVKGKIDDANYSATFGTATDRNHIIKVKNSASVQLEFSARYQMEDFEDIWFKVEPQQFSIEGITATIDTDAEKYYSPLISAILPIAKSNTASKYELTSVQLKFDVDPKYHDVKVFSADHIDAVADYIVVPYELLTRYVGTQFKLLFSTNVNGKVHKISNVNNLPINTTATILNAKSFSINPKTYNAFLAAYTSYIDLCTWDISRI